MSPQYMYNGFADAFTIVPPMYFSPTFNLRDKQVLSVRSL
jgi:hypothetical protein